MPNSVTNRVYKDVEAKRSEKYRRRRKHYKSGGNYGLWGSFLGFLKVGHFILGGGGKALNETTKHVTGWKRIDIEPIP